MQIIVLVKVVPDTYGERTLDLDTGLMVRAGSDRVVDEIDERALELALAYKDEVGAEVILLSMAPADAAAPIRKALAMGADRAVHVVDDELVGADLGTTAEALASAITRTGFDLVIAGNTSTDGSGGVVPAMLAELLSVPMATALSAATIGADSVTGRRVTDAGTVTVTADLPAVVSVTEALPEGRFPNFKGIMAAKKKPLEVLSLADLGVTVLGDTPRVIMTEVVQSPPRGAGVKITDEGDAGAQLAEFLVSQRLI
ncbi:electron transfer flavoprotein subunit beta/FixA family protein [Agrococcus sp. ARC_14]|uniref:electron transfer flavoprotein subunit beta/FixA family protein n=1 Tax=Agrococcus sp. ARC_14 TaxID=2919927 RepID=UPI001F067AE9|nr:electron transfer flavoprotein subunit beta/FixA family protein [Agrococcus sp. ARC_14]MCH1881382.1 electron transfer flavoprotein subunit beta/FixA family protein [Agrococcus sp. ARC_14]